MPCKTIEMCPALPAFIIIVFTFCGPVLAETTATDCQARLHTITGAYLDCLVRVEGAAVKGRKVRVVEKAKAACENAFSRRYDQVIRQGTGACSNVDSSKLLVKPQIGAEVHDSVSEVRSLITDAPPAPQAGTLLFYNNCAATLKIMSPTNGTINGHLLDSNSSASWPTINLNQNNPNAFMVAPVTSDTQCQQLACQNWSDMQAPGQRMGYMWGNDPPHQNNLTFAAYCQPTSAAAKQCTTLGGTTTTSPCCGSGMVYDKTFGTTFEILPNGGSSLNQDFIDLSTNYGSGPESPPPLCDGTNPNDCVSAQANIFFNVPVQVQMGNICNFPPGNTNMLTCTAASCPDAYQYPTDAKQAVCSAGTGYVVTFCPGANQLPPLASANPGLVIRNNLPAASPCPNGNTVSVFTSDGAQHVIQPGGNTLPVSGNYAAYPGFGLQVNNWYWTSQSLPVQANPQNPDNSGAQFMISAQCTLTQAPPVYGKGIETYRIASVTAKTAVNGGGCEVTIGALQPYTDAVTPGCCAPPLPDMANVCQGPWGVTNNQQPWPPQ